MPCLLKTPANTSAAFLHICVAAAPHDAALTPKIQHIGQDTPDRSNGAKLTGIMSDSDDVDMSDNVANGHDPNDLAQIIRDIQAQRNFSVPSIATLHDKQLGSDELVGQIESVIFMIMAMLADEEHLTDEDNELIRQKWGGTDDSSLDETPSWALVILFHEAMKEAKRIITKKQPDEPLLCATTVDPGSPPP